VIWQNPWAWLGLLALAVPVLIHLLGRRSARIRKFPTLRFISASQLMATRWTRPSDLTLLAVRLGIIAASVAALANPLLLTAGRQRDRGRSVARAIIVDTTESMMRASRPRTGGDRAMDRARAESERLASDASTSVILQTVAPAGALPGAVGWLGTQRGRREVVVISDFQTGTIDVADLAVIPGDIGVGLMRIDVEPRGGSPEVAMRQGSADIIARVTADSVRTDVEWTLRGQAAASDRDAVVILAGAAERARADAARDAALTVSAAVPAVGRPTAIVHRQYEQRDRLVRDAKPLRLAWEGDIVARLRGDSMLLTAASTADVAADSGIDQTVSDSQFVVVARTAAGRPVALAAHGSVDGVDRLLLFSRADAGSLASAALIAATMRASTVEPVVGELEPSTIPEQTLESWRRPAASGRASMSTGDDASDGRWFWMLALVLLGIETWMRRARREARAPEMAHERAA